MSFLNKLSAFIPFSKKVEVLEYFFALNITSENLTATLWTIEGKQLKILEVASESYKSLEDITSVTDKLLDAVLGIREIEPQKILFGVPSSWLLDENLKDEYLKVLRGLVKELELTPMAYVENSRALIHFLEKQEGVPITAILIGFSEHHLTVTVARAGKIDGVKVVSKGANLGLDIEKALLTFTAVETLPSKILIYGDKAQELKDQLLSYSWMSKLSFLHFPKVEILQDDIEIKSVCLAGATEIKEDAVYTQQPIYPASQKINSLEEEPMAADKALEKKRDIEEKKDLETEDMGFVVGDVELPMNETNLNNTDFGVDPDIDSELESNIDFNLNANSSSLSEAGPLISDPSPVFSHKKKINFKVIMVIGGIAGVLLIVLGAYLLLPKAQIKIFVEPKILETDAQVTADPKQKTVDENAKIIPGQLVDTQVSGTAKDQSSGKKQIGDPAKGTVVIYNKTNDSQNISKGATLATSNGRKFILGISVSIASQSASDNGITYGKANATVTAVEVGAEGNLPSGTEMTVGNLSSSQVSAKAEGNFSGGTSKEVTVVSDADQKRLLASLTSDLRKQAQRSLQDKQSNMKILEEALSEEIIKKSFNKNINDQASEFSLNLTVKYSGVAFEDKDLKLIVSKLVNTQVPDGFQLNLEDTETQANVSKLEKDGKLIFLARFKAKLLPKIDIDSVKNKIKGKSLNEAVSIIKNMDNVLGSEIKVSPALPSFLQRIPFLGNNIKIEVGLK